MARKKNRGIKNHASKNPQPCQSENGTVGSRTSSAAPIVESPAKGGDAVIGQTIQQQRARYALTRILEAIDNGIGQKEYRSYAESFPAMIRTNGLGQAAAFYRSKGVGESDKAKAYRALYELLSNWLSGPGQPYVDEDLLDGITSKNGNAYRTAQAEALLLLDWVKKFAKAFMEGGKG